MVSWVQRGGPLAEFADGYRDELACRGFTANSVVTHVVLMGQLSRWMAEVRVAVGALTPVRIEEFLDSRRAGGQRRVPAARVLDPLPVHLRAAGVLGPPLAGPATPLGDLLERYERHLVDDRGLAKAEPKTLRYRVLHAAARLVRGGRRRRWKIAANWPWAEAIMRAWQRICALPDTS
jgi:hypothetical protein